MDKSDSLTRLYDFLPDYVAGCVWLFDIVLFAAISSRYSTTQIVMSDVADALSDARASDVIVSVCLAFVFVLLPYVLALMLNPLGLVAFNYTFAKYIWLPTSTQPLPDYQLAAIRQLEAAGLPWLGADSPTLLLLRLEHLRSDVAAALRRDRTRVFAQVRLTLPTSITLGLVSYILLGRLADQQVAFYGALVGCAGAFIITSLATLDALRRIDGIIVLAYLAATAKPEV